MISVAFILSALSAFSFWRHKKLLEKNRIYTYKQESFPRPVFKSYLMLKRYSRMSHRKSAHAPALAYRLAE